MTDDRSRDDQLTERVGELRRLTIMFCDVVGSTELSGRLEPETYRELMRGYRAACREVIETRYEGHIVQLKGDGTLSVFGFPVAHENDAERAVRAGLALVQAVRDLEVRVAVHHGPVYLDFDDDDIYGLAANVGARLHAIADPGTVVVSDEVRRLVEGRFEIEAGSPQTVKGVPEPIQPFHVVGERRAAAPRSWATPLVGREAELERLREAWAQVVRGAAQSPAGLLVHGDAGVGKSRLVGALAEEARAVGAGIVELHGSPFHVDVGLHPVCSLVETRCAIADDADGVERLGALARDVAALGLDGEQAIPLLAPILGIDPSAGYEQAAAEGRKLEEEVAHAVLDYVVACADGHPALVVAENVHWFDSATRGVLADLMRTGAGNLLVVATSRELEPGAWEAIEVRPLTLACRFLLIDALQERVPEQQRLALAARSGGIPLYLEELVRAGPSHHALPDGAAPMPGSVPEVLYEPLVARLYATPAALPVAATAAAAGQVVDRALLAAATSLPDEKLASTLGTLVDARVLEPIQGRSERYQFRHELLREVAYELQPPSWRREVHSRLCDLLAGEETSDWHVLASHFERAERHSEAASAYQESAEWARRRGALAEARAHLTRAIDLMLSLASGAERDHREIQMRLRRGFLAMSAEGAGSPNASADFARCVELAAADPRGDDMFSTLISLWAYYLARAELDQARQGLLTLRAALDGARERFRPHNDAGFGMLDWFAGDFTAAEDKLETAIVELPEEGRDIAAVWFLPNDPIVAMHVHLGLARFMTGDEPGADEALAEARRLAAALDFPQRPWSTAYAMWLGGWVWIETDRLDAATETLAELQASSARHGFDGWAMIAATQMAALEGIRAVRSGTASSEALAAHAEALSGLVDIWLAVEFRLFLPFFLTTAGVLWAAAGDAERARQRYEQSLALAAQTGMRFYNAETTRRLAHLATEPDAVVEMLRSALELARAQGARPFELRIALDLHARSAAPTR
jgi:class 3 adenylate cyclase